MSVIKPVVVQAGGPTVIPITNTNLMQPTTIRVISPSQVFATTTVQQPPPPPPPRIITSEESFPTTSSREDSATQLMNDKNGSRTWIEKIHDWLFQKDFLNLYNLIWVLLATAIALAITATAICLTVVYCRQANADVTATTLQAGRFVTEGCSASSQCLDNGQCVGGQCQCVADFYYDDQMGQCLAVKTYGVACTDSRECDSTAYLGCYKPLYESLCLCPYGFFWGNYYGTYECLTYRSIGMVCQSTSDCAATSYCAYTGSDYRCLCQSGYYADSSSGQCTLLKQYNEPCNFYYNECDSNFFCRGVVGAPNQQYFCLCRSDYYFNGTSHSCLPTSTYGGWCFNVTHCNPFANLLCLNGACSCSATQYWNGTMCVDYLLYGQPCYNQTLCNPYDANLLCMVPPLGTSQTVCYCRSGYYFDEYVSQCAPVKYPNQNCTDSYECIDYAVCQWNSLYVESKVCMCVPGYFYKTSSSACVPAVGYGASCVSDTCNSILGLYCNSASVCDCRSDYFYDTTIGFCRLTYVSGDTCTSSTQCRPSRTLTCSAGTCGP